MIENSSKIGNRYIVRAKALTCKSLYNPSLKAGVTYYRIVADFSPEEIIAIP